MITFPCKRNMQNKQRSEKSKNELNLQRKNGKTKTVPIVRQTLTSYKRMLNANPLLKYEEAGINVDELWKSKSNDLKSITNLGATNTKSSVLPGVNLKEVKKYDGVQSSIRNQLLKSHNENNINNETGKSILPGNHFAKKDLRTINNSHMKSIPNVKSVTGTTFKSKVNPAPKVLNINTKTSKVSTTQEKRASINNNKSLRRSLSSGHLDNKKGKSFDPKRAYIKSNHSCSEDNLCVPSQTAIPKFTPILEESCSNSHFVFKTPSAHERRSMCHYTPVSTTKRKPLFHSSTPFPIDKQKLQERLSQWLKSRGKKLSSFHHLRCFGMDHIKEKQAEPVLDDENKENIDNILHKSESYENLNIELKTDEDLTTNGNALSDKTLNTAAKEALIELQKLIHEEYPMIQCLGWLELIKEKYRKIDEEPEYWECRAAIEQYSGNVGNAVEYYKTAIVHGAEVNSVDKSLDQLLKRFSLLNISPEKSEMAKINKDKERIVREARNVFKSTIIQFAIQERKSKTKSKSDTSETKLVATPVRRSTRLSKSGYVSTPGVKLCMSLKEIDTEEIQFEKNKAFC